MKKVFIPCNNFTSNTPIVVMFPGNHGGVNWDYSNNIPRWGERNFLIRNISNFLENEIAVILIDMFPLNPTIDQRLTIEHSVSVETLLSEISSEYKNSVTLLLNSAGAVSISNLKSVIWPVILISPVHSIPLHYFNVDAMVIRNENDNCYQCHTSKFDQYYKNLSIKFRSTKLATINSTLQEDHDCSARSPHGLWGADDVALSYIFNFIKDNR